MESIKNVIGLVTAALLFCGTVADVHAEAKKWHPGHYMIVWDGSGTRPLSKILGEPNFSGALVFHSWRELEPSMGSYNFSAIVNELRILQASDKRLALQIMDKTFSSKYPKCVPDYMLQNPIYQGGQSLTYNRDGTIRSCVPKRWIPAVQDRLIALYTALGNRFDDEPYFEAVQTTENCVSIGSSMSGYSVQNHVEQLKRGMTALVRAFPTTQVFQKANWGRIDVAQLFAHALSIGAGIGGPDILPTYPTEAYPFYRDYYGQIPLAIDGQNGVVKKYLISGEVDFHDLFNFATIDPNGLRANYVFWSPSEHSYWSFQYDVKPVVNQYRGYINRSCPRNISCR